MTITMAFAMMLQASAPPPRLLGWLEGEWVCRVNRASPLRLWRSETWRVDGAGRLVGTIRVEQATAGPLRLVEEARVAIAGHRLTYRTGGRLVRYRLLRSEGDEVIFESTGMAAPRRISFRPWYGRGLRVMHIQSDGRSESWTYRRRGTRSAPPDCGGPRENQR